MMESFNEFVASSEVTGYTAVCVAARFECDLYSHIQRLGKDDREIIQKVRELHFRTVFNVDHFLSQSQLFKELDLNDIVLEIVEEFTSTLIDIEILYFRSCYSNH